MSWMSARGAAIVALLLLVGAGYGTIRTFQDRSSYLDFLYNGDALIPAELYQSSVVEGYPLKDHHHSAATFAVPDVALYFATRAIVPDNSKAILVWVWLLFALLVFSFWLLGREILEGEARSRFGPLLLAWTAFYVGTCAWNRVASPFLILLDPMKHAGAAICALFALTCSLRYFKSGRWRWLFLIIGISAGAMFSDRLYGLFFAAPTAMALFFAKFLIPQATLGSLNLSWRRGFLWFGATAIGCSLGLVAIKVMQGNSPDEIGNYSGFLLRGYLQRLSVLCQQFVEEVLTGNPVFLITVFMLVLGPIAWIAFRNKIPGSLLFVGVQAILALVGGVVVLVGSPYSELLLDGGHGASFSRYLVGPMATLFFLLPVIVARSPSFSWLLFPVAAITTLGSVFVAPRNSDCEWWGYQPDYVAAVDRACAERGVNAGLADFWKGKQIRCLSRQGIRILQVSPHTNIQYGVEPMTWESNVSAYLFPSPKVPAPKPGFILTDPDKKYAPPGSLTTQDMAAVFGPPTEKVPVHQFDLLFFTNRELMDIPNSNCFFLNLKHRLDPKATIRYPATGYVMPERAVREEGTTRVADSTTPKAVHLGFGPYLPPCAIGKYKVSLRVTSTGSTAPNGTIEAFRYHSDPEDPKNIVVHHFVENLVIPPEFDGVLTFEIPMTRRKYGEMIEFRPKYIAASGGRLIFHWSELSPAE